MFFKDGLCQVALPVPLPGAFTYRIPESLAERVLPGVRVIAPFGARKLTGVVTSIVSTLPAGLDEKALRDIEQVLDSAPLLSEELLKLGQWTAAYYLAPEGEVYKAMLPLGVEVETRRVVQLTEKGANLESPLTLALRRGPIAEAAARRRFGLTDADLKKLERAGMITRSAQARQTHGRERSMVVMPENSVSPESLPARSKRAERVVQLLLSARGPVDAAELASRSRVPAAFLRQMAAAGAIAFCGDEAETEAPRAVAVRPSSHALDARQQAAVDVIREMLDQRRYGAALLYGVTGSGKTEVYMEAIAGAVRGGGSALMLVPEIALTPATAEQFQSRFGDSVAILHSAFPGRERSREWRRVRAGDARVVVGTRSAVFAPLERPSIVIVDEEHDPSYKQEETPRYNGRDLALVRARDAGAVAILGSATPSLESRYNAASGKYRLLELSRRVENRPLAEVTVVDMRQEFTELKKTGIFSRLLLDHVRRRLELREQVILLLNRRGYSSVMLCRSCGQAAQCANCSISLTHHKRIQRLLCHYCGYSIAVPEKCPNCSSEHLYFLGQGSEKIEALISAEFPAARVVRLDRDAARSKMQYEQILGDFKRGDFDILVGTQMIAKGHDIHRVTLVGVISADIALGLPDFRAAERTFQLLTQVAGRAGRGDLRGEVIIQTHFPDHYAIRSAAAQDYEGFYDKELRYRRAMRYPPYSALTNILFRSTKMELAAKWSGGLARRISERKWSGIRVLGPAAAPLARLKQEFRYQFLVKAEKRGTLHALLADSLAYAREQEVPPTGLIVDVDPLSLM